MDNPQKEAVMKKEKFLSREFLPNFHDKEGSLEKITDEKNIAGKIGSQLILVNVLALIYGIVMGCYNGFYQALSSAFKMPLLFSLLIIICFPAFYVVQSVLGSRLSLAQMVSIILSGFVYTTSIMVSFSTIVLFFLITGGNYAFIQLLHVAVIALAGIFGMKHIIDALKHACEKKNIYPKTGIIVFRFWIVILFFVGSQLSWSLRPFIGSKGMPFELFRKQEGNFYQALTHSLADLLDPRGKRPGM
jgi:hypothetical protein